MNKEEDDESTYQCETMHRLVEEKKYKEITDHVLSCCLKCVASTQKYKGVETLFPDKPPPWIELSEVEQSDPKSWEKYKKKNEPKRGAMSDDQVDEYLETLECGDEKHVWEIVRFKKVDRATAWSILGAIRKRRVERAKLMKKQEDAEKKKRLAEEKESERLKKADEKRRSLEIRESRKEMVDEYEKKLEDERRMIEEDEKEEEEEEDEQEVVEKKETTVYNAKKQMPWAPNFVDILEPMMRSKLSNDIQKRLSAMCQNKMYHGSFQHAANKREFSDLAKSTIDEYDQLAKAAIRWADSKGIHPLNFLVGQKHILKKCNSRKVTKGEEKFSMKNKLITIEMNQSDDIAVTSSKNSEQPKILEVLHEGVADFLEIPEMTKRCEINNKIFPTQEKLLISDDPNICALLKSRPTVSVAMDATTVCHLIAPNWESRTYGICIGIDVKNVEGKNIAVLSKPKPTGEINRASLQRKRIKSQIRSKFIKVSEKNRNFDFRRILQSEKRGDEAKSFEKEHMSVSSPSTSDADPLDQIFANNKKMEKEFGSSMSGEKRKIVETGYRYSIVQFGTAEVLVRSRPPFGIQYAGEQKAGIQKLLETRKSVSFEPRIEYLPNGGAMELGPEEWVWNYTKKLIKQSDSHLLFRTHYEERQILQVDGLTMEENNISARPEGALSMLSERTLMMEKLVCGVGSLETGRFLAYQDVGTDLRIVPSASLDDENAVQYYDLRPELVKMSDGNTHYFNGFSPDVMFQWQIVQGRAPRLFIASDSRLVENFPPKHVIERMKVKNRANKKKFEKRTEERIDAQNERKRKLDIQNPDEDDSEQFAQPHWKNSRNWRKKGRGRGAK